MKLFFNLSTIYRYLTSIVFTAVYLFSASTVAGIDGISCESLYILSNNPTIVAKTIDQQIFDGLTVIDGWSGKPQNFRDRDNFSTSGLELKNYPQNIKEYIEFSYDKLNDPYTFQEFIKILETESGTPPGQIPAKGAVREILIRMIQKGGFTMERVPFLQNHHFFARMRSGIAMLETADAFMQNGHGMDSHLVQLAYMIHVFDKKFGVYHFLAFYKYMGIRYEIWSKMFDHPSPDHLGNPSTIKRYVSPLLGLD